MSANSIDPRRLERLLDVGRKLVSHHVPEVVLWEVLEAARELTGAEYAALGILDEAKSGLNRFLSLGVDDETRRRIGPLPRGHGILGELIRNPKPLRLNRISDHPHSYGFPAEHPPMSTFLGVPVTIRGRFFGNVYLTEKAGSVPFDEHDEQLLVVLSEWAAVAIDNARAHEASRSRQAGDSNARSGASRPRSRSARRSEATPDLQRILELIVKRGRALVDGSSCIVFRLEDGELRVGEVAGEVSRDLVDAALIPQESPIRDAIRARRIQRLSGPGMERFEILLGVNAGSGLLVPLISRGVELGVLAVFHRLELESAFSSEDVVALESFATSASTSIHATRLIEDEKLRLSIASSERERQRWARELHDETLQELGALNVMLDSALQVDDGDAIRPALSQANDQVERVILGLQGLITELRPAALDDLGVAAAVEALVDGMRVRSGLAIELDIDLEYEGGRRTTRPEPELEATIYRTVQEALNNVVKHADASRARVMIEERSGEVTIAVEDDGRGIDDRGDRQGFGLLGMRERIKLLDGALVISAPETGGTRLTATLPVSAS